MCLCFQTTPDINQYRNYCIGSKKYYDKMFIDNYNIIQYVGSCGLKNFKTNRFICYFGRLNNKNFEIKIIIKHNYFEPIILSVLENSNDKNPLNMLKTWNLNYKKYKQQSFFILYDKSTNIFYPFMSFIQNKNERFNLSHTPFYAYNIYDKDTPCIISNDHIKKYLTIGDIKNIFFKSRNFIEHIANKYAV